MSLCLEVLNEASVHVSTIAEWLINLINKELSDTLALVEQGLIDQKLRFFFFSFFL